MPRNSDEALEWPEDDDYVSLDAVIQRLEFEDVPEDALFEFYNPKPKKQKRFNDEQV